VFHDSIIKKTYRLFTASDLVIHGIRRVSFVDQNMYVYNVYKNTKIDTNVVKTF